MHLPNKWSILTVGLPAIAAVFFCLISCNRPGPEERLYNKLTESFEIDTSKFTILPFDSLKYFAFKTGKPANLTSGDLREIERMLRDCINHYNREREKELKRLKSKFPKRTFDDERYLINLNRYKRQYFAIINEKGEKEVWVNCFCNTDNSDWKMEPIFVKDGGNCYFNVKINLKTKKYYELAVNGEA